MARIKNEDARGEICRECGKLWYIAKGAPLPIKGYICPRCRADKGGHAGGNGRR